MANIRRPVSLASSLWFRAVSAMMSSHRLWSVCRNRLCSHAVHARRYKHHKQQDTCQVTHSGQQMTNHHNKHWAPATVVLVPAYLVGTSCLFHTTLPPLFELFPLLPRAQGSMLGVA